MLGNRAIIQEEIAYGERILAYELKGLFNGKWQKLTQGARIGHKRIETFKPVTVKAIKLKATSCKSLPNIRNFEIFVKNSK